MSDNFDYLSTVEDATEGLRKLASATKNAASSADMMNGILKTYDTAPPIYTTVLKVWHEGRTKYAEVEWRCSRCNVEILPKDRFCEGCGAPV